MKTILWATLTANGNYAQSSPEHPPKQKALDNFGAHVSKIGNFIVGRRTFEGFNANGGGNAFANTDVVVVSGSNLEIPGVARAATPQEALNYLEQRDHQTALLVGGESLHNAFLAQNLIDEIVFNVAPTLESRGLNLVLDKGQYKNVQLLDCKEIGGGIVQLRYALSR